MVLWILFFNWKKTRKKFFWRTITGKINDKDYSKLRFFKHSGTRVRANWIIMLLNYEQ